MNPSSLGKQWLSYTNVLCAHPEEAFRREDGWKISRELVALDCERSVVATCIYTNGEMQRVIGVRIDRDGTLAIVPNAGDDGDARTEFMIGVRTSDGRDSGVVIEETFSLPIADVNVPIDRAVNYGGDGNIHSVSLGKWGRKKEGSPIHMSIAAAEPWLLEQRRARAVAVDGRCLIGELDRCVKVELWLERRERSRGKMVYPMGVAIDGKRNRLPSIPESIECYDLVELLKGELDARIAFPAVVIDASAAAPTRPRAQSA